MLEDRNSQHKKEVDKLVNLFAQGEIKETIEAGLICLKEFPQSYVIYNIMGVAYASISEFKKSEISYKESLRLNPKSSVTYANYGNLLVKTGRTEDGVKQFRMCIKYNPKHYKH